MIDHVEAGMMVNAEWSIFSGIITGAVTAAFGGGIAWATMKVGFGTRLTSIEKFVDSHDTKDVTFRNHCHDEVLVEIRELRRKQDEQFNHLNERFDQAASLKNRRYREKRVGG